MANTLMVIREDGGSFCLPVVTDVLRSFPDVQSITESNGARGEQRVTARCGIGNEACDVWLDREGAAIHILHPGDYGLDLARRLHAAFMASHLGGLEVFDQMYSFHTRLRDDADVQQLRSGN